MGRKATFAYDADSLDGLVEDIQKIVKAMRRDAAKYAEAKAEKPIFIDFQTSVENAIETLLRLQLRVESQVREILVAEDHKANSKEREEKSELVKNKKSRKQRQKVA